MDTSIWSRGRPWRKSLKTSLTSLDAAVVDDMPDGTTTSSSSSLSLGTGLAAALSDSTPEREPGCHSVSYIVHHIVLLKCRDSLSTAVDFTLLPYILPCYRLWSAWRGNWLLHIRNATLGSATVSVKQCDCSQVVLPMRSKHEMNCFFQLAVTIKFKLLISSIDTLLSWWWSALIIVDIVCDYL